MDKSKSNIPLGIGARVTHVSNKRYVVGVIVHQHDDGEWEVHWQMPPWTPVRESRGSYASADLKRTYVKEAEIRKQMLKLFGWNMEDAWVVE